MRVHRMRRGKVNPARRFSVVVMGASAGGIEALSQVVSGLAPDFPVGVLLVLHTATYSALPAILNRTSALNVEHARDGQWLKPGLVLVAPPDRHMTLNGRQVVLSQGPRQNNVRPAIDPLFKSAARTYGAGVIGVILSGTLDDGSAGLAAVKKNGGIGIVQSLDDAAYSEMPANALAAAKADEVLPAAAIGSALNRLVSHTRAAPMKTPRRKNRGNQEARQADPAVIPPGDISTLTCPECGGTLWERREGNLLRFLCHTGHGFTADSLSLAQKNSVENALWVALRALKERAMFASRMVAEAGRSGHNHTRSRYEAEVARLRERAELIQNVLLDAHSGAAMKARGALRAKARGHFRRRRAKR